MRFELLVDNESYVLSLSLIRKNVFCLLRLIDYVWN